MCTVCPGLSTRRVGQSLWVLGCLDKASVGTLHGFQVSCDFATPHSCRGSLFQGDAEGPWQPHMRPMQESVMIETLRRGGVPFAMIVVCLLVMWADRLPTHEDTQPPAASLGDEQCVRGCAWVRHVVWCNTTLWQDLHAVEFFAGQGELSAALRRAGLRCVSFDIKYAEAEGRPNVMNLNKPSGFLSRAKLNPPNALPSFSQACSFAFPRTAVVQTC
jgi:hypothetical protein